MDIEKLDKSLSYQSLESARQLAEEMKQQASDHAKAAGHERGLEFLILHFFKDYFNSFLYF